MGWSCLAGSGFFSVSLTAAWKEQEAREPLGGLASDMARKAPQATLSLGAQPMAVPGEARRVTAAECSACMSLPISGSHPGPHVAKETDSMVLGVVVLCATIALCSLNVPLDQNALNSCIR